MIYSIIILISSLLLFSVHSFYVMNAAVVEQCSTGAMIYLNKFDSNKMHCLNPTWRHVFIFLEYSCFQNKTTRLWTLQTNVNKGSNWPQEIYILTGGTEYTSFAKTSIKEDPTIEENSGIFNPNNNQLTTYMWTILPIGPQCRIRYTISKDICTPNKGALGAKLTDLVCYYGKQTFDLKTPNQRQALDKLLDNSPNPAQNNPSNSNNVQPNSNLPSLNTNKNKRYIIIAGIIVLVIIIIAIIFIIIRRCQSSEKNFDKTMSSDLNVE